VVAAVIAGVLALTGDDDEVATVAPSSTVAGSTTSEAETTTTTAAPSTTAAPTTTAPPSTSSPTEPGQVEASAVWPLVASDVRYADPVEAARGFAEELVGFTDPVLGEFQAGDSRSGEVEVRAREDGPVTTVLVRQLDDDDSWWVLGSQTADIQLDEPVSGSTIDNPLSLSGQALAFEGTVQVEVRGDESVSPVGEGFVTGSGGPDPGPFEGQIDWTNPDGGWGALVLYTMGGEDPVVWQATVVRIRFPDDA
jgi:hypothetical protein